MANSDVSTGERDAASNPYTQPKSQPTLKPVRAIWIKLSLLFLICLSASAAASYIYWRVKAPAKAGLTDQNIIHRGPLILDEETRMPRSALPDSFDSQWQQESSTRPD